MIKLSNLIFELILIVSMISIIFINLNLSLCNMLMQHHSFIFWILVIIIMVSNIILMIIKHRHFSIQSQHCRLQSFYFNFLWRNSHLRSMQLLLYNNFLFIYLLINIGSSCLLWTSFITGRWSFVRTHNLFINSCNLLIMLFILK